jgi:hypothetical protein
MSKTPASPNLPVRPGGHWNACRDHRVLNERVGETNGKPFGAKKRRFLPRKGQNSPISADPVLTRAEATDTYRPLLRQAVGFHDRHGALGISASIHESQTLHLTVNVSSPVYDRRGSLRSVLC